MPRALLIRPDSSKTILWLGLSKTWLVKAESKEALALLVFKALVTSSLCCCMHFSKFWCVIPT
jgi:hypothetical protein